MNAVIPEAAMSGSVALTTAIRNPESDKIPDYPWFDWLRFVLASIVVLGHHGLDLGKTITGTLAVKVFLALSGWLIGSILLKMEKGDLSRFYFNRATRIWIPYALAIFMLYGLAAVRDGIDFYWLKYLILDSTFTHTLYTFFPAAHYELPLGGSGNQFWSISVEEQFYLLAPLVLLFFVPMGRRIWFWIAAALIAAQGLAQFVPIALGVGAAIMKAEHGFKLNRSYVIVLAIAIVALFFVMESNPSFSLASGVFALGIVLLASGEGRRTNIGIFFGGLSFPLYLNHWIGIFVVHAFEKRIFELSEPVVIFTSYLLNVTIAGILYWIIDRNIQLRRHHWYSDALGHRLMIAGYTLFVIGIIIGGVMHLYGPHGTPPVSLSAKTF
jgi:peptidoglycan/LPS O-acetylase OafA/YrhL